MPPNPQHKSAQDTERAILVAAEHEFMAKGFDGARTTVIAERAGVTHAMLHYYFRTKLNLFERIVNDKIKLLKEALVGSMEQEDATLEDVVRSLIERHLDFLTINPELPRFIIGVVYADPERLGNFMGSIKMYAPGMLKTLQKRIDAAVEAGLCRKTDAEMLMLDIVSLNVFSFIAAPIINVALPDLTSDMKSFLARRKKENVDTIMRKLKP